MSDYSYPSVEGQRLHVVVAERAIGRRLPKGAVVHHVNGDIFDNRPKNLVICQDQAYHRLLHARTRLVKAGANPNTEKICGSCKQVKPLASFSPRRNGPRVGWCKPCAASWQLRRKARLALSGGNQ